MAELARSVVFNTATNELTVDGEPFAWEFVELQPVLGKRVTRRGEELVPAVQLTLLGATLEVLSAHTGQADVRAVG